MFSNSITRGHYRCVVDRYVESCPDTVDGLQASEEGRAYWRASDLAHDLLHCQSIYVHESFPQRLTVNVFVGIQADYQFISILPPLSQLCHKVLSESGSGAGEILSLCNEISSVLLIGRAAVRF